MTMVIKGISSMATRQVLAELLAAFELASDIKVAMESVGGVDAAKRVLAGEFFDVVVLASDAIEKLISAGQLVSGSNVNLVHSGIAVAVKNGAASPDISTEEAVRQAVLAAKSISYSTGPSGVALAKLFERWGISDTIRSRLITPPPGIPVGSLVAKGEVALGFQQLSEMLHVDGITVVGPLPDAIQIITTFTAGIGVQSACTDSVRDMLDFMCSPLAAEVKRRHGMEPA